MHNHANRLRHRLLLLALLAGGLFFAANGRAPVAEGSSCDLQYDQNIYNCTNLCPSGMSSDCPTSPNYSISTCQSYYTPIYDLCVLGEGPVGVNPQQPTSPPPRETTPLTITPLDRCLRYGTVPSFMQSQFNSCLAAGNDRTFCCNELF